MENYQQFLLTWYVNNNPDLLKIFLIKILLSVGQNC